MKITQKGIEDLGFTFIDRDEETGDDCSYNIPSNKIEGWYYLIVHHPSTNEIHISHHAIPLETTKDIHALENSVMTTMKELTEVLEKHKIISRNKADALAKQDALERLINEEKELGEKIVGLNKGLQSDAQKVGDYQFELLFLQHGAMITYRRILIMRINDLTSKKRK